MAKKKDGKINDAHPCNHNDPEEQWGLQSQQNLAAK